MSAAPRGIFLTQVVRRLAPCREHFELALEVDNFPPCVPGQLVQVLCRAPDDSQVKGAMLRRPFSVAGVRRASGRVEIDIIGRVVGPATAWLDARRKGDLVNILGPLGRGFSVPGKNEKAWLVAGGVGLPPIRWLCEILRENGHFCEFFFGALSTDLIPFELSVEPSIEGEPSLCTAPAARLFVPTAITTDDGSAGLRGRVTDALKRRLNQVGEREAVRVYTCGPEPMLEAVASLCAARKIPCEVALERVMGCGMATCQSCVVPIRDEVAEWKFALCCRDGPVFDATKVLWGRY